MLSPSKKKKHNLKRLTPKPGNQNKPKPYKPPPKYDPGILMTYAQPLLDKFGRKKDG